MNDTQNLPGVIDAEVVPLDELTPATVTLFRTDDPRVALERMSELADALVKLVRDRKLSKKIGGREHLLVEAWTTIAAMVGVTPYTVWTKANETGDGYVARVEARRIADGTAIGAAEAECARAESNWSKRDNYALRAMAQTRATSRALRAVLGHVVVLAGYEPAGAEEMPPAEASVKPETAGFTPQESAEKAAETVVPAHRRPTKAQMGEIAALLDQLAQAAPERDWKVYVREFVGVSPERMSYEIADHVIRDLGDRLREVSS